MPAGPDARPTGLRAAEYGSGAARPSMDRILPATASSGATGKARPMPTGKPCPATFPAGRAALPAGGRAGVSRASGGDRC